MKKLLHVGPNVATIKDAPKGYQTGEWVEIRYDIDESVNPDIVGDIREMDQILDESFNSVYSSHNIEHFYQHEVESVLSGFFRVLKDDGFLVIACPDLEAACRFVQDGKIDDPIYQSIAGPICSLPCQ